MVKHLSPKQAGSIVPIAETFSSETKLNMRN
nr:MAG TPA: hypothetical protein [Caudoviricetes sp.]